MKKIIYSIFASVALMFASCSEPIAEDSVAPQSGVFSVVTNLDITSRASTLASDVEFYLNIDQATDDYFVKMRNIEGVWKAYSVEEPTSEVDLMIYGNVNDVVVSALCCDKELSAEEFASPSQYSIATQAEIFYATNGANAMGTVSISESGVISIEFGMFLSRLDVVLSGEDSLGATVKVSGVANAIEWCALTNEPFTLVDGDATIIAEDDGNSTYSCFVAPQSVSYLKFDVATSAAQHKVYMVGDAEFSAGESRDVTLRL